MCIAARLALPPKYLSGIKPLFRVYNQKLFYEKQTFDAHVDSLLYIVGDFSCKLVYTVLQRTCTFYVPETHILYFIRRC